MALDMATSLTIKANVVGEQELAGLRKGLGGVEKASNKTSTAMTRLQQTSGRAINALRGFVGVVAVAGLARFAKSGLDAADSMSKLSQRTGIAAPSLDKFRKVAELSDTSIQSLERAFPALTKNMDMAAQKGKGPAFEAFERLGISVKNVDGSLRAADDVFLEISDRFEGMADGSEKAALASAVFGTRIGSELIPLLNSGGDAVRNMSTAMTQEFADRAAAFNDRIENMQEKLGDLGQRLLVAVVPALEALVGVIETLVTAFTSLPQPLQTLIASVTALGAAFLLLSPLIGGAVTLLKGLAVLKIGATIAGWLPAILGMVGALKGLGAILIGVFTGPVGWAALLVAAGVAIYSFRDQIGQALAAIGDFFKAGFKVVGDILKTAAKFYMDFYVKPILGFGQGLVDGLVSMFKKLAETVKAPFVAIVGFIKGIINGVLRAIVGGINSAVRLINRLISGYNRLPTPDIPLIPEMNVPQFAKGGVVNGPTLAMVGEGGESEYIVPQSKASGFAKNWMAGRRGIGAIPGFAEGGVVNAGSGSGGTGNTTVQVTTGPVLQQEGKNYVTVRDLEGALKQFSSQMYRNQRSYGGRRFQGVAG